MYRWAPGDGSEPVDVLSVTTIRRLTGITHAISEWQIGNVVRLAMGVRKVTRIGPRGGVKEVLVPDGEFPGEFVTRLLASHGDEKALADLRRWLRESADEPRDIAAIRGSVVHSMAELNIAYDRITDEYLDLRFNEETDNRKRRSKLLVTDDDRNFARSCMRQYWHMRAEVPFVILRREPQTWNLSAGYAGSADILAWFPWGIDPRALTPDEAGQLIAWNRIAPRLTLEDITKIGGVLAIGDYKTSKDVYGDHVVQVHAYLAGEFIGQDGKIDGVGTELLRAANTGALIHIRPNSWEVDFVDFRPDVLRAFLGSCAFARFVALHERPTSLFTGTRTGSAPDTELSAYVDDDTE